jgi:hypothetical protein
VSGSNGLHPVANLTERQKCPEHPTKMKYADGESARAEAARRSTKRMPIAAYLCTGCGQYHLTKSVGGDSITLHDGKLTVGEFQSPDRTAKAPPEPELPLVVANHNARVKVVRAYLLENPSPTSEELCAHLGGCTKSTLSKVMKELAYHNTRGRNAKWIPDTVPPAIDVPVVHRASGKSVKAPVDIRPDQRPRTVDLNRIHHVAIGDLVESYAAAGFRLVLTLEDTRG